MKHWKNMCQHLWTILIRESFMSKNQKITKINQVRHHSKFKLDDKKEMQENGRWCMILGKLVSGAALALLLSGKQPPEVLSRCSLFPTHPDSESEKIIRNMILASWEMRSLAADRQGGAPDQQTFAGGRANIWAHLIDGSQQGVSRDRTSNLPVWSQKWPPEGRRYAPKYVTPDAAARGHDIIIYKVPRWVGLKILLPKHPWKS